MPDRPPPERQDTEARKIGRIMAMALLGAAALGGAAWIALDVASGRNGPRTAPHAVAQFCQGPDLFLAIQPQGAAQPIAIMVPGAVECATEPTPEPLEFH